MSKFYRLDFIYEIRRFKWRFDLFSGQKPWKKRLKKAEIVLRGGIPRISADIRGISADIRGYPRDIRGISADIRGVPGVGVGVIYIYIYNSYNLF